MVKDTLTCTHVMRICNKLTLEPDGLVTTCMQIRDTVLNEDGNI